MDIEEVVSIVGKVNENRAEEDRVKVVVDNTFATPYCQRPLEMGVDLVVGSLTKNIGGFGTDLGGYVACARTFRPSLFGFRKDFGGVLLPRVPGRFWFTDFRLSLCAFDNSSRPPRRSRDFSRNSRR